MKKILLSGLVFTFLMSLQINAQNHAWCGITPEGQNILHQKRMHYRTLMNNNMVSTRAGELWLPLKIHVVTKDDGSGSVVFSKVYDMICELNESYLDQEIQFFVDGDFNIIESTSVYNNPNVPPNQPVNSDALSILNSNKFSNAINIFIVDEIPSNSGGDVLGFYDPNRDWLVLQKNQVSSGSASTVIHEMGHYFTLDHPFYGWEEGYDVFFWGDVAPTISPGGVPTELMNGNNCQTAGDGICDTPPSYNFGTSNNCNYTGGVKDPNEVPVDPLEENIMDYFIGCSESFTAGQKAMIAMNVDERANLHTNLAPDVTPLASITPLYPIDGEETAAYTVVGFSWEEVPGATEYLVEVDKTVSFNFNPSFKYVTGPYVEFSDIFNAGSVYYWRVKPLKEGYYCAPPSNPLTGKFRTGEGTTSTKNINEILNWKISPNPVSAEQTLNINIETIQSFDAKISIYNLSGQKIKEETPTFSLGASNHEISVANLNEGMYILSIESETGIVNEKIVVTR